MKTTVYRELAQRIQARMNCEKMNNTEWYDTHGRVIQHLVDRYLPKGSGFDSVCTIDDTRYDRLIIFSSFHLMDGNGYYDGWIDFIATVKPSLTLGIDITIKGPFSKLKAIYRGIPDYIFDCMYHALTEEIDTDTLTNL